MTQDSIDEQGKIKQYLEDEKTLNLDPLFKDQRLKEAYQGIKAVGVLKGDEGEPDIPVQDVKRALEEFIWNKRGLNSIPAGNGEIPLRDLVLEAVARQYQGIVTQNVRMLESEKYRDYLNEESMGGNASGSDWQGKTLSRYAGNLYFDDFGNLVDFGNYSEYVGDPSYKCANFIHFGGSAPGLPKPGFVVDELDIRPNGYQQEINRKREKSENSLEAEGVFKQDIVIALTGRKLTQNEFPRKALWQEPKVYVIAGHTENEKMRVNLPLDKIQQ